MGQLRPRDMTQAAFAALLQGAGFEACSKAAVSLAERPKDSGVQFTQEAKNAARALLTAATEADPAGRASCDRSCRPENRKNGRKTTVWLDDEMRSWCETQAYLLDIPVGELIRELIRREMERKTAPEAATSEAAEKGDQVKDPITSDYTTKKEEKQA